MINSKEGIATNKQCEGENLSTVFRSVKSEHATATLRTFLECRFCLPPTTPKEGTVQTSLNCFAFKALTPT